MNRTGWIIWSTVLLLFAVVNAAAVIADTHSGRHDIALVLSIAATILCGTTGILGAMRAWWES